MGLLRRLNAARRAAIAAFRDQTTAEVDRPTDVVTARVFGKTRKVRLIAPQGFYHVHAESIDDGGPQGSYLIDVNSVVPSDTEKFRRFVQSKQLKT